MKLFWHMIASIFTMLVLLLAVILLGLRIFGFIPHTIQTSTMEPAYPIGALIYVRKIPTTELVIGDAISFSTDDGFTVMTQRIASIDSEAMQVTTKADANNSVDGTPVHFNDILGKVSFSIPYLGYVSSYIRSPRGRQFAIVFLLFILLLFTVSELLRSDKRSVQENEVHQHSDLELSDQVEHKRVHTD